MPWSIKDKKKTKTKTNQEIKFFFVSLRFVPKIWFLDLFHFNNTKRCTFTRTRFVTDGHGRWCTSKLSCLTLGRTYPYPHPVAHDQVGGDQDDDYPEYDIEYTLLRVFDWLPQFTRRESAYRNKHSFPRIIKQKNISKSMRRMGKLKQLGGASCNQRH